MDDELNFYGSGLSGLVRPQPKNGSPIRTLGDLYFAAREAWCAETARPECSDEWFPEDPCFGQCVVTALLVHDMFGGDLCRIRLDEGMPYYFNKINGEYVDLTWEQFDNVGQEAQYEPNETVPRAALADDAGTAERYALLKKRIAQALSR